MQNEKYFCKVANTKNNYVASTQRESIDIDYFNLIKKITFKFKICNYIKNDSSHKNIIQELGSLFLPFQFDKHHVIKERWEEESSLPTKNNSQSMRPSHMDMTHDLYRRSRFVCLIAFCDYLWVTMM